MNISIENEVIWLAPERTATSITKKIFENYNFSTKRKKNNFEPVNFLDDKQSHENIIFEEYKNFKIITNIRNPYDRVFGCYNKFYLEKPLMKISRDVKEKFNTWIEKTFLNHGYEVFLNKFYSDDLNYLNKWTFEDINPDYIIKTESIYEDLLKLPFINSDSSEDKQFIFDLLKDNPYLNKRYYNFNECYEFQTAKLIYHFYKPVFYKFGYSPFSFTTKNLNEKEKVSFLHGPLD